MPCRLIVGYDCLFMISATGSAFLPMRNVLWDSAVTKTMGIHPTLISLIRIYILEYRIYELFRINWTKSRRVSIHLCSLKTKYTERHFKKSFMQMILFV